ncbi:MAG TPA: ADP-ribosylglycohydrolase family protein [Longimicrobium sp.]|nr:ADP-ribosylglycohydrolase family protein [Longimicrobium sp.]
MIPLIDRYRGSMMGLAVGDALGASVEFMPPGTFAPVTDMMGGGPHNLMPGEWTDDMSMAICLAESLVERRGFDPVDQLRRYLRWYREGYRSSTGHCFDIGITVRQALDRFAATGCAYCGSTDPDKAGNGSLMRLAPVPLYYARDPLAAIVWSGESSRTTHASVTTVDACRWFAALMVGALNGVVKEELLGERWSPVPGYFDAHPLAPEVDEVARGSFRRKRPPEIVGSGYVVRSLEAALWAFHTTDSFADGCLAAANLGHDADTTAAIYGQLAGAFYGMDAIPALWHELIALRGLILRLADALHDAAQAEEGEPGR